MGPLDDSRKIKTRWLQNGKLGSGGDSACNSGAVIIIQFNSILYFNVLTQQLQEPITESAQV
jgi:hypothetical protein